MSRLLLLLLLFCSAKIVVGQPVIHSFSPASSFMNGIITIKGKNFDTSRTGNLIRFGTAPANVIYSSSDSIVVFAPNSPTHDFISITTNGLTAYSKLKFIPRREFPDTLTSNAFPNPQSYENKTNKSNIEVITLNNDNLLTETINASDSSFVLFVQYLSPLGLTLGKREIPTNVSPGGTIAVRDLNGDFQTDIVSGNTATKTIHVFLDSTKGANARIGVSLSINLDVSPTDVAIDDMDADGRPDIIAISDNDSIYLLRNTSSPAGISFASPSTIYNPGGAIDFKTADIDGDLMPELILIPPNGNYASIYKNQSTKGTISFSSQRLDIPTGRNPKTIELADLNKDLKLDIITGNSDSTITLLKNESNNGVIQWDRKSLVVDGVPLAVKSGDLNGDGRPDLAVSGTSLKIDMFQNLSRVNEFSFAPKVSLPVYYNLFELEIVDMNLDGKEDIVGQMAGQHFFVENKLPKQIQVCPPSPLWLIKSSGNFIYEWEIDSGYGYIPLKIDSISTLPGSQYFVLPNVPPTWHDYKLRSNMTAPFYVARHDELVLKSQKFWGGAYGNDWEDPRNWWCPDMPFSGENIVARIESGTVYVNSVITLKGLILGADAKVIVRPGGALNISH
jgi:large repetitive protein